VQVRGDRCFFNETFEGSSNWVVLDRNVTLVEANQPHYVAAWLQTNTTGKFWISLR
jgi:hypothetical protein